MSRGSQPDAVPAWPVIKLRLAADGTGTVDGEPLDVAPGRDPRDLLLAEATRYAQALGRPVRVRAEDVNGVEQLVVHPDGRVVSATPAPVEPPVETPIETPIETPVGPTVAGAVIAGPDDSGPAPVRQPIPRVSAPPVAPPDLGTLLFPDPQPYPWPDPRPDPQHEVDAGPQPEFQAGLLPGVRPDLPSDHRPGSRPPSDPPRRSGRRGVPSRALVVQLSIGTVVALVLFAVLLFRGPGSASTAGPAASAPGPGIEAAATPVHGGVTVGGQLPPGYRAEPTWCIPVATNTSAIVPDGGGVLTRAPTGSVVLLDPETGAITWQSGPPAGASTSGPWPITVDGRPAAAVTGPDLLQYWFLPTTPAARPAVGPPPVRTAGAEIGVGLPAGGTVNLVGTSPLVSLDDGTPAVIRHGAKVPAELPAGARALMAEGDEVIAVKGSSWVRQRAGAGPAALRDFPVPAGATGEPLRVDPLRGGYLAVFWAGEDGQGPVLGVIDTGPGTLVLQGGVTVPGDLTKVAVHRAPTGTLFTIGPVLIDPSAGRLGALRPDDRVVGLLPGHVYLSSPAGAMTDLRLGAHGTSTEVAYPRGPSPVVPLGLLPADPAAPARSAVIMTLSAGVTSVCAAPAG